MVYENKIMVCGGFDGFGTTNKVEMPQMGKTVLEMSVKRSALSVCVVNGCSLNKEVLGSFQSTNRVMHMNRCQGCGAFHGSDTSDSEEESSMDEDEFLDEDEMLDFIFHVAAAAQGD